MSVDLTQYVSNVDKNVYVMYNLPEEVIAVIFAYVSRSARSFRENLKELLEKEDVMAQQGGNQLMLSETAKKFHERWVVGYGHSSVAEHAVAHIGIEKVSRLASSELELANPFNSFTEYSQRYQRPQRGAYYVPQELWEDRELLRLYTLLNEEAFDTYEFLVEELVHFLKENTAPLANESPKAYHSRIEKTAFEDARYVLTLGTLTNLGLTGNGRSLRDTLVSLLSSTYQECIDLAKTIEFEVSRILPTLLRHVGPSPYLVHTREVKKKWEEIAKTSRGKTACLSYLSLQNTKKTLQNTGITLQNLHAQPAESPTVNTLIEDYESVLNCLTSALLFSESDLPAREIGQMLAQTTRTEKERLLEETLEHLAPYENPHPAFAQIRLRLELKISEANWHQLLRHNRRTHFVFQKPNISGGITIPPHIREAGLNERMQTFLQKAEQVYGKIAESKPTAAAYCVTNAHRREVLAELSLWELYHLINLRTSQDAQWDIRETFNEVYRHLQASHPVIARFARRR